MAEIALRLFGGENAIENAIGNVISTKLAEKRALSHALTGDKLVRETGVSPSALPIDVEDVQGLIFRGYGTLHAACYVLLQLGDAAEARAWLAQLWPEIARGVPAAEQSAVHVAFTYAGLRALGLPAAALDGFSRSFSDGMIDEHRSRFLGDTQRSAPEHWSWGGPNQPAAHAVLMLFAKDEAALTQLQTSMRQAWLAGGITELTTLQAAPLRATEHFGFADGISQPAIEGYHPAPSDLHLVKSGEFLLGYPNEYGEYTERPLLDAALDPKALLPLDVEGSAQRDLGRNGSYLVFRQLRQDVPAFRRALEERTCNPDGTPNLTARDALAARMVGRWQSGASLVVAQYGDDASKAKQNEFRYHDEDPEGLKCPIGAHVRRANPRDALPPGPGSERSLAVNHKHRLIRRGRSYGEPLPEGVTDDQDRGLYFIAVNADISRQFEFIQHSWLVDPRFNSLSNEADPLLSAQPSNAFSVPHEPVRARYTGLPRFVTVAGGAYFFMPGIRALRFLAELTP